MTSGLHEHHISVTRTARYYTLGRSHAGVRELWIVCHGFGQLAARFLRHFEAIESPTRLIVAPEALSRYYLDGGSGVHGPQARVGATWMTREDRLSEIGDYVGYLDALAAQQLDELERDRVRVTVLGFSQGAATVCRWIAGGTVRADRLILWAGAIPPEFDLVVHRELLGALELVLVLGTADELVTGDQLARQEERLQRAGVAYRVVRFDGGHKLDDGALRGIAQLGSGERGAMRS